MTRTDWECAGAPGLLLAVAWLMPVEPSRWAPLEGQYYQLQGTAQANSDKNVDPHKRTPPRIAPEPGGPVDRMWKLYSRARVENDALKRASLVWQIVKVHVDEGPFFMGVVANYPQIEIAGQGFRNTPKREDLAQNGFVNGWEHPTPAVYDPETWFKESAR